MISILTRLISSLEIRTDNKSLRTFGFGLAIILLGFSGYLFWFKDTLQVWLAIAGALTGVLTIISPQLVLPVYYPWMSITKPLGMIITYILLSVTFYIIMLPVGVFLRLRKKDLLNREWHSSSYWEDRESQTDKRMNRMF